MRAEGEGCLVVQRPDEPVGFVDGGVDGSLETETDVAEEHFVGCNLAQREEQARVERESVHFCSRLDALRVRTVRKDYGTAVGEGLDGLAGGEEVESGGEVCDVVAEGLEGVLSGEDHLGERFHFILVLGGNGSEVGEEVLAEEEELVDVTEEGEDGVLGEGVVWWCVVLFGFVRGVIIVLDGLSISFHSVSISFRGISISFHYSFIPICLLILS